MATAVPEEVSVILYFNINDIQKIGLEFLKAVR
jgi:hypothetical protein